MGIEKQSRREVLLVAQLLRLCEKALAKSHASVSSLIGYVADDLEREMCEVLNVDKINKLKVRFSDASRPKIPRSN
jgi:hypothetical protein